MRCDASKWQGFILNSASYAFTVIFSLEILFRIVASGLWGHPNSIGSDGWNFLDIAVVAIGWLEILPFFSGGLQLSALRC